MNAQAKLIHCDPEILGGAPIFVGTRVPLRNLVDYLERGHSLDEFLDEFPTVSREQVVATHQVRTVQQLGWAGLKNGELLRRANEVSTTNPLLSS